MIRRTSAADIKVLYAATVWGPGNVIVPVPWEARLLDEPVSRATVTSIAQFLSTKEYEGLVPRCYCDGEPTRPRIPSPPPFDEQAPVGEPCVGLFARHDLPWWLRWTVPAEWAGVNNFLWWRPARGFDLVLSTLFPKRFPRKLAPVGLVAKNVSLESEWFETPVVFSGPRANLWGVSKENLSLQAPASPERAPVGSATQKNFHGIPSIVHGRGLVSSKWVDQDDDVAWWSFYDDRPTAFGAEPRRSTGDEALRAMACWAHQGAISEPQPDGIAVRLNTWPERLVDPHR